MKLNDVALQFKCAFKSSDLWTENCLIEKPKEFTSSPVPLKQCQEQI